MLQRHGLQVLLQRGDQGGPPLYHPGTSNPTLVRFGLAGTGLTACAGQAELARSGGMGESVAVQRAVASSSLVSSSLASDNAYAMSGWLSRSPFNPPETGASPSRAERRSGAA